MHIFGELKKGDKFYRMDKILCKKISKKLYVVYGEDDIYYSTENMRIKTWKDKKKKM